MQSCARHATALVLIAAAPLCLAVEAKTIDFSQPEAGEALPGGAATHHKRINKDVFSQPSANMAFEREMQFKIGNGFFKRLWVSAPASTQAADGLGPLYNARSCQRCHLKDGRGHPPEGDDDNAVSMFLRISIPPQTDEDRRLLAEHRVNNIPDPVYGTQLQDFAIAGHKAEYRLRVRYEPMPVKLADGTVVTLRKPTYSAEDLGYGPLHPQAMLSPRVAPQMLGLGLLEAISDKDILAKADPDDADGDGISGRPNRVWSPSANAPRLGRFGHKAGAPSVDEQSQGAFTGDIGISTPFNPYGWGECTEAQVDCRKAPDGNSPQYDNLEAGKEVMALVTFYARNLAVPARRDAGDPQVLAGKRLFYETGCTGCHTPSYQTRADEAVAPEQRDQHIWPYTDLLLHDMGEGLADGRPEGMANGREWKTPPLWGIGLTPMVNGHNQYLHDGRARGVLEAILWHGGEARAQRDAVAAMPAADREALIRFVESL
ncbi:di-heme oxidoreductase family protein [Nitrogeniibacter aestuarii]|uniref:di-heme oxidoreductase family protein n=1 Tax=Nitrogeniibacter aestuarii TaxID=2815343 RepID=UPI001E4BF314|nr:di-heme oxidoredictase family protein [Nitrogeniibacter aestuarii]